VGQGLDQDTMGKDSIATLLERTERRTVKADYLSGITSQEGVFAAGDLVSGPATVVEAIGGGRRAAEAMDRWLAGRPAKPELPFVFSKGTLQEVDEANFSTQAHLPRAAMTALAPQNRKMAFSEVELGLSEDQARAEAARCLACGCQAAHDCRLREIASEVGLRGVVNNTKPSQTPGIRSEHPYVIIEDGKCIVCRRCENACAEYHGRAAVRVEVERADDLGRPRVHRVEINDQCDGCGLCVSLCPTGALSYQRNQAQPLVLPLEWRESVCHLCPLTCRVKAGSFGGHLIRVEGAQAPPNFGHLCQRGRYELVEAHASATRILTPLVRGKDGLEPADWGEALDRAARSLANLRQRHGAQCLGGLTFGRASLEELYLFGKLVRLGLGSNHLDYLDPGEDRPVSGRLLAGLPAGVSLFSLAGLERSGLVVAVGSGLSRDIPLMESALCRQKAAGGRLALLGRDPDLGHLADLKSDTDFAAALGMALDVALEREADLPSPDLGSVLILVREAEVDHMSMPALTALIEQVRGQAHVGLALVPRVPSVMALRRAGISPAHYPSHRPLNPGSLAVMRRAVGRPLPDSPGLGAEGILQAIEEGSLKGLILQAGHSPTREPASARLVEAAGRLEILVVLASHEDPLTRAASVVLPTQLCLEKAGTFRGLDGSRHEAAPAALAPDGMWDGLEVLAGLLHALGGPAGADDAVGVQSELIVLDQLFAEAR
jgi:formate dehydrogenase major subunit